jgi:hypothetical protein
MPQFVGMVQKFVTRAAAGIIDQNIHAAKAFTDRSRQPLDLSRVGYVTWDGQAAPPQLTDLPCHLLQLSLAARRHNDIGSGLSQGQGDTLTDSPAGAGHYSPPVS